MINDASLSKINYHTQHIKALDGLRGYAAILVTFYHAILHIDEGSIYRVLYPSIDKVASGDLKLKMALILFNGSTSVLIFYVLSGAVLCQSLLRDRLNLKSISLFLMRRIFRLFPALFICMASMWLLSVILRKIGFDFPVVNLDSAIWNALLINTSLHGPSTSIQIELLATPFIIFFAFAYQRYSLPMGIIIFALSIFSIQRADLVFLLPNMHANMFVFISGMLVALPEARLLFDKAKSWQIFLLVISAFFFRHIVHFESLPGLIAQVFLLAAVVGFIRWAYARTALHNFLEWRFSQLIGRISYSYYLLNVPVLWIIWYVPTFYTKFAEFGQISGGLLSGVVAMIITVPFAYLSYRYCELFFMDLGAKITKLANERVFVL